MSFKLLTEHHFESLFLKGGNTGSSESTIVKMSHCWKSRVTAHVVVENVVYINTYLIGHGILRHLIRVYGLLPKQNQRMICRNI